MPTDTGKEAKLYFMGHALMENRNGLVVDACLTEANGHAERIAALHMIEPRADRSRPITLGADRGYDAEDFVNELRSMKATPHVAQNTSGRSSAVDGRTTRHAGYAVSQRIRKRIEEAFGWIKTVAGQERTKFRGRERVGWAFTFAAAAYNLARLPKLLEAPHEGPGRLPPDRPLADRRGRPLGSRLPRPLRSGDADRHRAGRRNRLWSHGGWSRCRYARNSIGFRWAGCDEGDEVRGEGTAELLDDGTIEIEFAYDNGDEAVLKAKRDPSSTAC